MNVAGRARRSRNTGQTLTLVLAFFMVVTIAFVGVASAHSEPKPGNPEPPENLQARPGVDPGEIILTWNVVANDSPSSGTLSAYRVYRDNSTRVPTLVGEVAADKPHRFVDSDRSTGSHTYHVSAVDDAGRESPMSDGVESFAWGRRPAPTVLDADADLYPDAAESAACGDVSVRDIFAVTSDVGGSCANEEDLVPGVTRDEDGDAIPDEVEVILCYIELQFTAADGTCAEEQMTCFMHIFNRPSCASPDYRARPPSNGVDDDRDLLPDAIEGSLCEIDEPADPIHGECYGGADYDLHVPSAPS